jgi:anti-anti-sigma factor
MLNKNNLLIQTNIVNKEITIKIKGTMNKETIDYFNRIVNPLIKLKFPMVFDLSQVHKLDTFGTANLIEIYLKLKNKNTMTLINISNAVRNTLNIVRLSEFFEIKKTNMGSRNG